MKRLSVFFSFVLSGMRDQFSRLLEDSGLVPSSISGDAVNYFSGNMELVKVSRGDDVYNFRIFHAFYEMTLLTYFQFFQKKKVNKRTIKVPKNSNHLLNAVVESIFSQFITTTLPGRCLPILLTVMTGASRNGFSDNSLLWAPKRYNSFYIAPKHCIYAVFHSHKIVAQLQILSH